MSRAVFLLGAGASVEAGLPTSFGMTREILGQFEDNWAMSQHLPVLQFIIGGIQFGRGIRGTDATQEVNVEELFEAVEMLGSRNKLPIAPFVGLWSAFTPSKKRKPSLLSSHQLEATLTSAISGSRPTQDARSFVRQLGGMIRDAKPPDEEVLFRTTAREMIHTLFRMLVVRDPGRLDYLLPLLDLAREEQLTIATLNYDNCLELAAEANDVELTTGIAEWSKIRQFRAPDRGILLLKLHGSLSWSLAENQKTAEHPLPHDLIAEMKTDRLTYIGRREPPFKPAIVFGAGNKLTPKGPFLDLLRAFGRALAETSALVICGYGFGDEHINQLIGRWFNGGPDRKMTVIGAPGGAPDDNPYSKLLARSAGDRSEWLFVGARSGLEEVCARFKSCHD